MTTLNELAAEINANAAAHGFWDSDRNMGEMLMLAVSELSEALEEHRAGRAPLWWSHNGERSTARECSMHHAPGCTPKPEGVAVEIADCIIRCLDTMQSLGVDIDAVVAEKMAYNATRPRKHGKAY